MRKLKTDSNRERFLTIEELKVLKEKLKQMKYFLLCRISFMCQEDQKLF